MSSESSPPDPLAALGALRETLLGAVRVADRLGKDGLAVRLLAAFDDMPVADRAVIVDVIEREVKARQLSQATEKVTGQSCTPNPHARLYIRSHTGTPAGAEVPRSVLEREEMMLATLRALRVVQVIPALPDIYEEWKAATRNALAQVDEPTLDAAEKLIRDVMTFLAEAREREVPETPPAPPFDTAKGHS